MWCMLMLDGAERAQCLRGGHLHSDHGRQTNVLSDTCCSESEHTQTLVSSHWLSLYYTRSMSVSIFLHQPFFSNLYAMLSRWHCSSLSLHSFVFSRSEKLLLLTVQTAVGNSSLIFSLTHLFDFSRELDKKIDMGEGQLAELNIKVSRLQLAWLLFQYL